MLKCYPCFFDVDGMLLSKYFFFSLPSVYFFLINTLYFVINMSVLKSKRGFTMFCWNLKCCAQHLCVRPTNETTQADQYYYLMRGDILVCLCNSSVDMTVLHSMKEPDSGPQLLFDSCAEKGTSLATSISKVRQTTTSIPLIQKTINPCCSQWESCHCHGEAA